MVQTSFIRQNWQILWRNQSQILVGFLCLLHLIPIWGFTFIPTQDGISHVYNSYILKEWNNPDYTKFHQVYDLNLTFFPNWSNYAFFYLALHIVSPLIAEKIYVSICVLLFPFSFYYLLTAINKRLRIFSLLGFLYSYNYLLQMGFYNFTLAFPLCLISIGYWWKYKACLSITQVAVLNLLIIGTYFSHFGPFTMLVFTLTFFAFVHFLEHLSDWQNSLRKSLSFFGYMVPVFFILLNTVLKNPETLYPEKWLERHKSNQFSHYLPWTELWNNFLKVESLVYFNDSYIIVSKILLIFICLCIMWTIIERIHQKQVFRSQDVFLFLSIILVVLYFKLPWRHGSPGWINPRINLFIFPVLLGWFVVPKSLWFRKILVGMMLLMTLWHLGLTIRDYHLLNKDMKEFMAGTELIRPDSSVSLLETASEVLGAKHHGPIKYLSPFYHGACYYCFENGSHYVGNYEPKYHYFPLHYKNGNWKFKYVNDITDYVITWRASDQHPDVKSIKRDYKLIYQTENLKLYQHSASRLD